MKMPNAYWPMTYAADRRNHKHRCACCNKVIQPGAAVFMCKTDSRTTRCMHQECAAKPFGGTAFTGEQFIEAWGMAYLAGCGYKDAKAFMDTNPINKPA